MSEEKPLSSPVERSSQLEASQEQISISEDNSDASLNLYLSSSSKCDESTEGFHPRRSGSDSDERPAAAQLSECSSNSSGVSLGKQCSGQDASFDMDSTLCFSSPRSNKYQCGSDCTITYPSSGDDQDDDHDDDEIFGQEQVLYFIFVSVVCCS